MDTSHLQKAQGVAGVVFTVSSSLCPSFAWHHGLERCILIQWWSIKFKGAFQRDSKHMQGAFGNFFVLATFLVRMLVLWRCLWAQGKLGVRNNADLWTGDPTFCFDIHTSTSFPIPSFELFLPVRPQRRACHKSIQIKSNLKPNHMRPNHTHKTYI